MRIAFLGKGGSGKTTLSSLFIRLAPKHFSEIYAIDADINVHLAEALSIEKSHTKNFGFIYKHYESKIRSQRPELKDLKSLPRTLPPWDETSLITLEESNWSNGQQINLTELGSYDKNSMGWSCHHSALGKLQLVLSHTKDTPDQLIVVDLTAGSDVFGVGMLGLFDEVFVAVEPTIKSTNIFNQLSELAAIDDVELTPIANKVIDDSDIKFIESQIGFKPEKHIKLSNFVRRLERGEAVTNDDIEKSSCDEINSVLSGLCQHERDHSKIKDSSIKAHQRAAAKWPKNKFEIDLLDLINPSDK